MIIQKEIKQRELYIDTFNGKFVGIPFENVKMESNRFEKCEFNNVEFNSVEMLWTRFTNCTFIHCTFTNVKFIKCVFDLCSFDKSGFDHCTCRGENIFSNCTLEDVRFTYSDFTGVFFVHKTNFDKTFIFSTIFNKAQINGCFTYSTINESSFKEVNFTTSKISNCHISDSNFFNAYLVNAQIGEDVQWDTDTIGLNLACPEEGAFIAWKKCGAVLVKLLIPADAKRSSATSYKCRASKAKVLGFEYISGKTCDLEVCWSQYDKLFKYHVGQIVKPDKFDENRWCECSNGIHFFVNKQNAINYN